MKHVFVETNWVVDYCAPAHQQALAAIRLLDSARSGAIQLHLLLVSFQAAGQSEEFQPGDRCGSAVFEVGPDERARRARDEQATRRVLTGSRNW